MYILETLVLDHGSARYASVCRAWQTIIEPRTFARLNLTHSRLAGFRDIAYRRRHLVKYIWFPIGTSEYYCLHCGGVDIPSWHQVPTEIIRKTIQDLVIQLSTWEPRGSLVLDVSVEAPSGLRHSSNLIQYGPGVISEPKKAETFQCSNRTHQATFRERVAYKLHKLAKYGKPKLSSSKRMPKARAVTSLLLRRQIRRPWTSEILQELQDLLPEVHEIHYEPWRDWRRMEYRPTDTSKARDTLL